MNSVGTIPPFVTFNRNVNDFMNGCVYTRGTFNSKVQEFTQEAEDWAGYGEVLGRGEGIYSVFPTYGSNYISYDRIIICGYSAEEMANLFFQIKSITYSWTGNFAYSDREISSGNDEDGNPIPRYPNMTILSGGWNGSRTYFASNYIGNTGDPTYSYFLPQMRSCERDSIRLFHDPSEDIIPQNVMFEYMNYHMPFVPKMFEDGTFFFEIRPRIYFQTGFYGGEYDPHPYVETIRPKGYFVFASDLAFPYSFHLVPFTFSDGNRTVNGNLWVKSDHGQGLKLESFDMTLNFQVNRFSFS